MVRSRTLTSLVVALFVLVAIASWPQPLDAARAASPDVARSAAVRPLQGDVVAGFDGRPPVDAPWAPGNRGVDLEAEPGEPVRADLDGVVAFSGVVAGTRWVTVDHGGGLVTTYGDVVDAVPTGRRLRAGDVLGRVASDTVALHWGARLDGVYVDPLLLLRRWRPRLVPAAPPGRAAVAAGLADVYPQP